MVFRKNIAGKGPHRFLAGLLCAGMILSDSPVGVLISTAAEGSALEYDVETEKNVLIEGSNVNEENDSMQDIDNDGENGATEVADTDEENNSTEDVDTDGEGNSTEGADTDGENNSTEDADADVENASKEDSDTDAENGSTEDDGTDAENDSIGDAEVNEENSTIEDVNDDEKDSSVQENDSEITEQSDETEVQPDEDETIPRVEFSVSDIYYFDAIINVSISNCTDTNREFYILLQNTSKESEPKRTKMTLLHETWYLSDLEAGSTYKMWCDADDVEQQELTFTTMSFNDINVNTSTKTYVSGVDLYVESNLPISQSAYDWPVCYVREKGEEEWKRYGSIIAEQVNENTLVYSSNSLDMETEYEYMVEWTIKRGLNASERLLWVKDQIINGSKYFSDENYNDYSYETFKTKSVYDAVALITDMKLTNGGVGNTTYTVTVSELDETVRWSVTYRQCPTIIGMGSGSAGWPSEDGWIELDNGGYSLTFELDCLTENKTYEYDFSIIADATYMVFVDNGTFTVSGNGSNTGSGSSTVLTRDMFSVNWEKANVKGGTNGTYGGSITYTGKAVKPKVTKNKDVKGITYKVSYQDNKNAGTARIVITGTKKCSGTLIYMFTIKPITPENASDTAKVKVSAKKYSGNANSPKFTVKYKGKTLKLDKDYQIKNLRGKTVNTTYYYNSKNLKTAIYSAQEYTYTVEGINNYRGTLYEGTFTVKPCSLSKVKITLSQDSAHVTTVKIGKQVQGNYEIVEKKLISSKGKTKKYRVTVDLTNCWNVATTDKKHTVTKICTVKEK